MKLCSQCEFIYEDDQERCDMDGGELVYEPTLESVFPDNALQARIELERRAPARIVIPLSRLPKPETLIANSNLAAPRGRLPLQIAAVAVLAAVSFMAFYGTPRLFQTKAQTANNPIESQQPKFSTFDPLPIVSDAAATSAKPETPEAKPDVSQSPDKRESRTTNYETAFPALPGLKPLPRLKPLPTLKPIPKLSERSQSAGRKAIFVNTSANTKKDSRFGSFLKKTGRMLTKPFKS
jgi:hypothetical protein